jgi:glutathione S-transferase
MKFYNSIGPNPRMVRMFMQEKGIEVPFAEIDVMGGENRRAPYTAKNPGGQMPCLELDDGTPLAETVPICEYLEDTHPTPALIGATAEEKAETRMWTRRIELNITENLYNGFRFAEGLAIFKDRLHVIPQAADDLKTIVQEKLAWLDALLEGKTWIVGNRFTLADMVLFAALDFATTVGQPRNAELKNLDAWFQRVAARPSAEASQ